MTSSSSSFSTSTSIAIWPWFFPFSIFYQTERFSLVCIEEIPAQHLGLEDERETGREGGGGGESERKREKERERESERETRESEWVIQSGVYRGDTSIPTQHLGLREERE
jgi:hypothetical protein